MLPVVFTVPWINYDIPGYGLMLMIGFLLTTAWATRRTSRSGGDPDVILNCAFIALLGGVVGGRAMYVLHNLDEFINRVSIIDVVWGMIDVRKGGLEVYGGVILATIVAVIYLRLWGYSVRWYLDIIAPSLALGMAIGRLGCFLNSCCWGGVCDLPWAMQFPYGSGPARVHWEQRVPAAALPAELIAYLPNGQALPVPRESFRQLEAMAKSEESLGQRIRELDEKIAAATGTPRDRLVRQKQHAESRLKASQQEGREVRAALAKFRKTPAELAALAHRFPSARVHPAQLYSFLTLGLIALLLSQLYWRRSHDGEVIALFFILEPVSRWLLEVIRADNPVDTFGSLFTISQGIAMTMFLLGCTGYYLVLQMPRRSPRAQIWVPPPEASAATPATS